MANFLQKLLGLGSDVDVKALVNEGAVIVDVRTAGEYARGHVKGSVNMPLDRLSQHVAKLKKMNKTIITCCQSGNRSGIAAKQLNAQGLEAYNGGGWYSVQRALEG